MDNSVKREAEQMIKEVSVRIRAVREDVGISAAEMAEKLGIPADEYLRLESGSSDFGFSFIYKIAQICGVEISDLMAGQSPSLTSYTVTRKGEGMRIVRREGFVYSDLAAKFKNKIAEPFHVVIPYDPDYLNRPMRFSTHKGQELDIVIKGTMKIHLGDRFEVLREGDSIYYDSATPHSEIAIGGEDCEIYAIVLNPEPGTVSEYEEHVASSAATNVDLARLNNPVYEKFVSTTTDENGVLNGISFHNTDSFNFAFDVVDVMAEKAPDKTAMVYLSKTGEERRFTFSDIARRSAQAANYFASLGIKKGDKVMLVLKRHYQFWFCIVALHRLGAVTIPATHLLTDHDYVYRYKKAGVAAVVCTSDDDAAAQAEKSAVDCGVKNLIIVGGKRDGWHDFDAEFEAFPDSFPRPDAENTASGNEMMLAFFTSGTTGYPKLATHSCLYPLGHFITAKYWHNVDPNGLHLTVSDTGWGKALWGKIYGQWLCEAAVFVFDFDRFNPAEMLPLFARYNITTFCAPPTIFRYFIKEDLSKYDLSMIRYATTAGEALNPEVYNQFLKTTGLRIMEGFGQTETTLTVANLVGTYIKPGSMGKPSPLYDVDIINDEGESAKVGEVGEIVIRTSRSVPIGLYMGYYDDEELTRNVWHDGVYHTGDTAWRDEDGFFWYFGRVDDLIKSSGYRIGPFEIESVIMELPFVLECAVTAVPDEIRGQIVKATVVTVPGTEENDALKKTIQEYVKEHTAPYKYPRVVEFIKELPKTISSKIRRVELRENAK